MFDFLIFFVAAALLIGFIAALVHYPLNTFAGADAKPSRWTKFISRKCGEIGLFGGGFIVACAGLSWLLACNFWLYAVASLAFSLCTVAFFGALVLAAVGLPFLWPSIPTAQYKAIAAAVGLFYFASGISGLWITGDRFIKPVFAHFL